MKDIDFEKRLEVAKEILQKLNNPEITLNDSIKLYKEGKSELLEASNLLEKVKLEYEEYQDKEIE